MKWEDTVCLAHLVLLILNELPELEGVGEVADKIPSLLRDLEDSNCQECDDAEAFDLEALLETEAEVSHDPPVDGQSIIIPHGEIDQIFGDMNIDLSGLVRSTEEFAEQTMSFALVVILHEIAEIFEQLSAYPGMDADLGERILEISSDPENKRLCSLWQDFESLAIAIREEAVYQWMIAGDLISTTSKVEDGKFASHQDIRNSILQSIEIRDTARNQLKSQFDEVAELLLPLLDEVARLQAPDSGAAVDLFDSSGNCLCVEEISDGLRKAISALQRYEHIYQ